MISDRAAPFGCAVLGGSPARGRAWRIRYIQLRAWWWRTKRWCTTTACRSSRRTSPLWWTSLVPRWHDMIWHDMTWHNMIWHNMIWHDMTWHDMTWHDMTWHNMIWYDILWNDIWYHIIWYMVRCDMMWCGVVWWYDMIWYDMIWYDIWDPPMDTSSGAQIVTRPLLGSAHPSTFSTNCWFWSMIRCAFPQPFGDKSILLTSPCIAIRPWKWKWK